MRCLYKERLNQRTMRTTERVTVEDSVTVEKIEIPDSDDCLISISIDDPTNKNNEMIINDIIRAFYNN